MSRKEVETIFPLSPVQQGMFYDTSQAPASGIHIEQLVCTLQGRLDVTALRHAWQWEVNHHATLRTSFVWEGQAELLQAVLREVEVPFEQHDWREFSPAEQARQLEVYLKEDRHRGFKLSHAPLMRIALFQTQNDCYQFIWTRHHILMDGWCSHQILHEVFSCYRALLKGEPFCLPPGRPYQDYVLWLKQQDLSKAEQFWRNTLQGFSQPTPLGKGGEALHIGEQEERFSTGTLTLPVSTTTRLQTLLRQKRLTLNTLLQGIWALLLSHYSGKKDILFGITVSGRPSELTGSETIVGLCINTLPLRVAVTPEHSLWAWLESLQAHNLTMREFEYTPGGLLYHWSSLPGTSLLYESLLVVENYPANHFIFESSDVGFSITNYYSKGAQTKYALTLLVLPSPQMQIFIIYDRYRFVPNDVELILAHIHLLLESIASHPDQAFAALCHLLSADEIPTVHPLPPQQRALTSTITYVAPRTVTEEAVAAIWSEVLGMEQIGIHDNFFTFGGHSLLATQIVVHLQQVFQVNIPIRQLFDAPTIAEFVPWLIKQSNSEQECQAAAQHWLEQRQAERLLARLEELSDAEVDQALEALLLEEEDAR